MELLIVLIVGAAKLYLLLWVLLGVFGMVAMVCLDIRAVLLDIAAWMRRKRH